MASTKAWRQDSGSLGKALAILRCFVDRQEQWGVKELSVALDLPPSTVHRILKIFSREGFLTFDAEIQKYKVGMELFRFSSVLGRRIRIREVAQRFMRKIVDRTGESCWLALFDAESESIVYVDETEGPHPFRLHAPIGHREPMTEGAAGLAVLAFLPQEQREPFTTGDRQLEKILAETRSRGCAVVHQSDAAPGHVLAAPIFDAQDRPIGCIGMAIGGLRPATLDVDGAAALLARTTARLSQALGSQLLAGSAAGTWRLGMGVIADLVNDQIPDLQMTASWGAGNRNLDELARGTAGYCMTVAASLDSAFKGRKPFSRPHPELRGMFSLFPLHLHIVARRGLGRLTGIADLRGLRISPAEAGFSTAFVFDELFRIACGHSEKRPAGKIVHLDYAEANRQLRDSRLDVVVALAGVPNPPYSELAQDPGIELVEVEADVAAEFVREQPAYDLATIPAGTYPSQRQDIQTLKVPTVLCTVADRPEDEVYAITKAVYDNRDQLALAAPAYSEFSKDFALTGWSAPIHPGAERFWRELDGRGRRRTA